MAQAATKFIWEPDAATLERANVVAADAQARLRRLLGARSPLAGRPRLVLARGDRGHGARVLAALGRGRRPLARAGVGDLVRRREGEHRLELRASLGRAPAGRGRRRRARRGRRPARADVRGALARGDAPRRGARPARRRARATASRSSCRCRPRSPSRRTPARTSARSRCRSSPASRRRPSRSGSQASRGEGRDHGARRRRAAAARCRCSRSSRRRGARRRREHVDRRARGTSSSPTRPDELPAAEVDSETPYLLTYTSGTTGHAEGRRPRPGRLPRLDRARGLLPGRRRARRPIHFVTDMGWIMGPWTVVGGARARLDARLRRGRAGLAAATGSGS